MQAENAVHCESSQLIGHLMSPQARLSVVCAQLPPKLDVAATTRLRVATPQPMLPSQHETEHEDQLAHRLSTQSCGHSWRLQSRTCLSSHSLPPNLATEFCSKRVWVPDAPQEVEHVDQAPQLWTQSCGHWAVLHSRSWTQYSSPLTFT